LTLLFAGTRGEIESRSPHHRRHSTLVVRYRQKRVVVDCGLDWLGKINQLRPNAIVLTHAHPDHAGGLKEGAPCVVYAPAGAWNALKAMPIEKRRILRHRQPTRIFGVSFEAFEVEHSILAPAVGYRIGAAGARLFYAPDLVYIHDRSEALAGIDLYIGDGATLTRPLIRKRGKKLIGHAPIQSQLAWCGKEGVSRAVFTHCGSEVVSGNEQKLLERIRAMGEANGVEADLAHDGLEIKLQ
jgi:phosphoribosyl 1,2-cyclic phosphodiesterase